VPVSTTDSPPVFSRVFPFMKAPSMMMFLGPLLKNSSDDNYACKILRVTKAESDSTGLVHPTEEDSKFHNCDSLLRNESFEKRRVLRTIGAWTGPQTDDSNSNSTLFAKCALFSFLIR